jgi:hypothetical protein
MQLTATSRLLVAGKLLDRTWTSSITSAWRQSDKSTIRMTMTGICEVVRVVLPTVPVIGTDAAVIVLNEFGNTVVKEDVPPDPPPVPLTTLRVLSSCVVDFVHPVGAAA